MSAIRNVVCAVSGGVDSAVAALLLKKKGFNVLGAFMRNWDIRDEQGHCSADQDYEDAEHVCRHIGIEFHEVNFVKEYWTDVFSRMLDDYEHGLTPNPDVLCNKHIKFGHFFEYARTTLGADAVATGHYARNSAGTFLERRHQSAGAQLLRSVDLLKDQTLFLAQIPQASLQRTMFPIGDLTKDVVKKMAMEAGLEKIAKKKESMGICFIGSRNFSHFIEEYIEPRPGNFIDIDTGRIMGRHKGIHYWTVGQRSLLGGYGVAYFVASLQPTTGDIFLAKGTRHPALFTDSMTTGDPYWINEAPAAFLAGEPYRCMFRFQHAHPLVGCHLQRVSEDRVRVTLDERLRAITAGQYAVFYSGEQCLGSAEISAPGRSLNDEMKGEEERTADQRAS